MSPTRAAVLTLERPAKRGGGERVENQCAVLNHAGVGDDDHVDVAQEGDG
jgi:hypothetical protein